MAAEIGATAKATNATETHSPGKILRALARKYRNELVLVNLLMVIK
jgi:hypothetical protein